MTSSTRFPSDRDYFALQLALPDRWRLHEALAASCIKNIYHGRGKDDQIKFTLTSLAVFMFHDIQYGTRFKD